MSGWYLTDNNVICVVRFSARYLFIGEEYNIRRMSMFAKVSWKEDLAGRTYCWSFERS